MRTGSIEALEQEFQPACYGEMWCRLFGPDWLQAKVDEAHAAGMGVGQKTVTRRLGWACLRIGDRVCAVRKAQGLRKGEKVERLAELEIVTVNTEPLNCISGDDVEREGFLFLSRREFVYRFCAAMRCDPDTHVRRIEFRLVKLLRAGKARLETLLLLQECPGEAQI